MVIVEHILRDIVNMMPDIMINNQPFKPQFHWGDKKELNRYLDKKGTNSYPLIWLLSPDEETHRQANDMRVERRCNFVIAHLETEVDLFNDERYINSFDIVLNPLTYYLQQAIVNSSITRLIDPEFRVIKRPNYSETDAKDKNGTVDLWDAVQISCNVEFNNFCLNNIAWLNLT